MPNKAYQEFVQMSDEELIQQVQKAKKAYDEMRYEHSVTGLESTECPKKNSPNDPKFATVDDARKNKNPKNKLLNHVHRIATMAQRSKTTRAAWAMSSESSKLDATANAKLGKSSKSSNAPSKTA